MKKFFRIFAVFCSIAAAIPAAANASEYRIVDRASNAARWGMGEVYGGAAVVACEGRSACRRAGRAAGRAVYDASQRFSVEGGQQLEAYGRSLRNRHCGGNSGMGGTTPQYCR